MQNSKHQILIKERSSAEIDGVNYIRTFDDEGIVLESTDGKITLEGHELKIENLDKNSGRIVIVGNINAVYYSDSGKKKKGILK